MTPPIIFCAIDTPDIALAETLAASMAEAGCGIKLGLEFFCANGPGGVEKIRVEHPGLPLFLDLKFHDIPNTVAGAVRSATALAPTYMTVHASGGIDMMKAAREAAHAEAARLGVAAPRLLAVTVLTSFTQESLKQTGVEYSVESQVQGLAEIAIQKTDGHLDGLVCSPREVENLRACFGPNLILMVPGIRPAGADQGDQKRVMTPAEAMKAGATHLVIGRPITGAKSPGAAARAILDSLQAG
ncbi:MAG TPA: orotidine-5'-phosphate decarboxylase [Micavibrio sp.]